MLTFLVFTLLSAPAGALTCTTEPLAAASCCPDSPTQPPDYCSTCCTVQMYEGIAGCKRTWGTQQEDGSFEPPLPGTPYYGSYETCMTSVETSLYACMNHCPNCGPGGPI